MTSKINLNDFPLPWVYFTVERSRVEVFLLFFLDFFNAKFQTTFVVCFFLLNKLSLGKKFICKVERLNVKQHRSR